jgi:FAD/FMN-containing dehydrogenase
MEVQTAALEPLRAAMRGTVVAPDDPGYDEARAVYNAMIDRRPAAVARCVDAADVMAALAFAREQGLRVAVRSGAHNGAGLGTVDDGLVVDLGPMEGVLVDPETRLVRVQAGARLGAVDHAAHPFGLAVPAGIISTTGVGGLTLGGGIGHLTRGYGLTVDNLVAADVVLADGSFVVADESRNSDLFWALRGGGGNFGAVTAFTFRAVPVSTVLAGPVIYDLHDAPDVLRWWREFGPAQEEALGGFFAFLTIPPGPPFPEELHLRPVCAVVWTYAGDDPDPASLREARAFGTPILDGVAPVPFPAWNSAFDAVYPAGLQNYWRADFFDRITDEAVERHLEFGSRMPSWQSTMHLYPVDGAAARVGNDDTAWAYRDARWASVIFGVDHDPAGADRIRDWCVDYWEALHPSSMGGAYVNFMMEEGQERVQATYRGNYARLARVKAHYDPDNLFSVNQNIRPAG